MKFRKKSSNYWISLSDIMTGLMIIFMFIAISYIIEVQKKQEEKDQIVKDYVQTKVELYEELKKEFENDFREEKWNAVLDRDLSIRFLNETVLFDYDKADVKPEFQAILLDFFPRYLNIILKEKYRDKIAEIRIEGHTDSKGKYFYNVYLSQTRTRNVLEFLLSKCLKNSHKLSNKERELLIFWLTANGFSSGRTLDSGGQFTLFSALPADDQKSRRVEFRIITASEKLVEEVAKYIDGNN
ncbi:MAG: OmpA family protein [Ignavibacteriae bacterium]|nr:OmpA family protein [Ignavibacteriota bacterium]NOG98292.1 OmpA family protein [Ignavibacteriota bacterium]